VKLEEEYATRMESHGWVFPLIGCRGYDADTLMDLQLDLGFGLTFTTTGRLFGINAPEVRGKEREAGIRSREWLQAELDAAEEVTIKTIGVESRAQQGKFGRWLIVVFADGVNLNEMMVWKGMAETAMY